MIPLYSAILKWTGCVTATNANLRKALNQGSCAVVVDGIAGMYVNEPKKEMIKFSGRKGFVRAAVETGTAERITARLLISPTPYVRWLPHTWQGSLHSAFC